MKIVDEVLDQAAGFGSDAFASEFEGHDGVDHFIFADGVEIDVKDVAVEGVVLDILDEGQLGGGLVSSMVRCTRMCSETLWCRTFSRVLRLRRTLVAGRSLP